MSAETDARQAAESHLELEETIRRRAHELYWQRGGDAGSDLEDWLRAEREVLGGDPERAQDKGSVVGSAKTPG